MASMRDIKRRRESVQSTQQITKAMKLVSTVKLQRARARAESSKPYFEKMYDTIQSILSQSGGVDHIYLKDNGSSKKAVIVITSNRGLAGGYNNNVVRMLADSGLNREDIVIYGIGRKGIEALTHRSYQVLEDDSEIIDEPLFADAAEIGKKVLEAYRAGEVGEIYIAYTYFKNTVVHDPRLLKLLPISPEESNGTGAEEAETASAGNGADPAGPHRKFAPMNFEPEAEEALEMLVPKYINSIIYGAFIEAIASENGARMQAMDSATSNAEEMIAKLSLAYNRARQGAITQELTEIISGAEALN